VKRIIKKCRHPDAFVKCLYKEWRYLPDKNRAVRTCTCSIGGCPPKELEILNKKLDKGNIK